MKRTLIPLLLYCAALTCQAEWLLASSQTLVKPGQALHVTVIATAGEALSDELPARMVTGSRAAKAELLALAPERSGRRDYRVAFPPELEGLGTLELLAPDSSRLLVQLLPAERAHERIDALTRIQGHEDSGVVDLGKRAPALSSHEPMYFVLGSRGQTTARFQLSFKYRLFDPEGWAADLPFSSLLTGLYFGYTQNSLWDWGENSKPFRDTTYKPAFFHQWGPYRQIGSTHSFSAQAGYEHQSNGKDGGDSRSIDTVFVKPTWRWELDAATHLALGLKAFSYIDRDRNNHDIGDYRGHALLTARYGQDEGWLLAAETYPRTRGSLQLDLSYRLKKMLLSDAGGFLHFQYFTGHGESLLDYNLRNRAQFRVGFSIVR